MKKLPLLLSTMALALVADPARAAVTIDFVQGSTGVAINVSGSIDTSSFTYQYNSHNPSSYIVSSRGVVVIRDADFDLYTFSRTAGSAFGVGSILIYPTSVAGIFGLSNNGPSVGHLLLPTGYIAGTALSASAFFSGATFSSLSITPTDFSYSLGGGQTVNFAFSTAAAPGVPEPATWAMMLIGMGALGFVMRRRSPKVAQVDYDFA